jgi:hypothetical protein
VDDIGQGHFSVLRWRTSPTRDEARNVAVLLVGADGGALRAAPLSSISPRLHEQGILDAVLVGLEKRLTNGGGDVEALEGLSHSFDHALVVTDPKPVAIRGGLDEALTALYRAYVAPRGGGSRKRTKGVVLDSVVNALRKRGYEARRGEYVGDFIFDVVLDSDDAMRALEVLSFAVERKSWTPIEQDAAHYLYGLRLLRDDRGLEGAAVVEPPADDGNGAREAHDRILRWFDREHVPIYSPEEIADPHVEFEIEHAVSGR